MPNANRIIVSRKNCKIYHREINKHSSNYNKKFDKILFISNFTANKITINK